MTPTLAEQLERLAEEVVDIRRDNGRTVSDRGTGMTDHAPVCRECEHFSGAGWGSACRRRVVFDPVHGWLTDARSAQHERARWVLFPSDDRCGPSGKHWKPRHHPQTRPPSQLPGR